MLSIAPMRCDKFTDNISDRDHTENFLGLGIDNRNVPNPSFRHELHAFMQGSARSDACKLFGTHNVPHKSASGRTAFDNNLVEVIGLCDDSDRALFGALDDDKRANVMVNHLLDSVVDKVIAAGVEELFSLCLENVSDGAEALLNRRGCFLIGRSNSSGVGRRGSKGASVGDTTENDSRSAKSRHDGKLVKEAEGR